MTTVHAITVRLAAGTFTCTCGRVWHGLRHQARVWAHLSDALHGTTQEHPDNGEEGA